jgi:hypothetical protein
MEKTPVTEAFAFVAISSRERASFAGNEGDSAWR